MFYKCNYFQAVVTAGFKPNRVYNVVCSEQAIQDRSGKNESYVSERYKEYEYFKTELDQYFKKYLVCFKY